MQEETRDGEFRSQIRPRPKPAQGNACLLVLEGELEHPARVLSMFEGLLCVSSTFQVVYSLSVFSL